MNKTIVILIFSFLSIQLIAQNNPSESGGYNYAGEINNLLNFPKSPEAEAFEKYGNTQVNLYTGKPNIDIPLHVLQGKEYNIPISLSYDAGGIKVNQVATNVGLGWNLVCGGRISVMVNGLPDYGSTAYTPKNSQVRQKINQYTENRHSFASINDAYQYADFLKKVGEGDIDTQYDYYSINIGNINDYIIFDSQTYEPRTLKNPNIKVTGSPLSGWVITDEDGTKYFFGQTQNSYETTNSLGNDAQDKAKNLTQNYVSSWLVSRIESKNRKDIFNFSYNQHQISTPFKRSLASKSAIKSHINNSNVLPVSYNYQVEQLSKTSQSMLSTILYNGEVVALFSYDQREDIIYENNNNDTALKFIDFQSQCGNKQIEFSYSYFGSNQETNPVLRSKQIRLKLDEVKISGHNSIGASPTVVPIEELEGKEKKYSFEYIQPEAIPSIESFGQDYYGLYNGANNNLDLIPTMDLGSTIVQGAFRKPVFPTMTIGTLYKITYPTGGYSIFDYEPHSGFEEDFVGYERKVYKTFAATHVPPGVGSNGSISSCMLDALGSQANTQTITFTLTESDFQTVPIYEEGMTYFSPFYIITDGYAFIKRITQSVECTEWGQPFCPISSHNHNSPQESSHCFMAISQCIDPYLIDNTVNANLFCYTNPITQNYIGIYNTGGIIGSSFSKGFNLQTNQTPYQLNSPGIYQLTLIGNPSISNTVGNSAIIYREEMHNENLFENIVSGFRIKTIKNFTNDNVLSTEKYYQYTNDIEGTSSSSKLLEKNRGISVDKSIKKECHIINAGTSISIGIDEIYSIGANEPYSAQENVVYRSVFEIQKKDSINMGYTQHKFNVGQSGFISNGSGEKYFEHNETYGKPLDVSVFNQNNLLISKELNEYKYFNENPLINYATNTGFAVRPILDLGEGKRHLILYNLGDGQGYGLFYYYPEWNCWPSEGGVCCPQPLPLDSTSINHIKQMLGTEDIHPINNYGAFDYQLVPQFATSIFGAQIKKTSIEYHPNGELVTEQEFIYDQSNFNLLKETKTTNLSDNSTISQVNYYPSDYTQYDSMISDNRLTEVIKTETYRNGELLQVRENEYANHVNGWFPSVVKIAKGEQDLEPRMFIKYDYAGNIIEIKNSEDPTSETVESYIWGYNKKYPVAKIAGVQHQNIPTNLITAIENVTVYDCAPELNANLLTAYQNLQNALPTAQITFYSYHANGKLKAMTSPNGQTIYYHYDELQRLVKVVDQYGAILSENEYKFRTQN